MKPVKFLSACLSGALALGLCLAPAGAASFTDTVGHVAEEAISLFADLKILEGDGNGHFFPDQSITRGDLCTILNRVFTYTESVPNTFPDLDESMWYAEPMLKLCAAGIVQGDGTGIRPLDTIRWDEALVMIALYAGGIVVGILAALKNGKWQDMLLMAVATIGVTIPSFVIASLLIYAFSYKLNWLPTYGLDSWQSYILPVIAMGGYSISYLARLMRSSLLEVMGQDYIRTARAQGLTEFAVVTRHALRNALIPVITVLGPTIAGLLTGSFVVEKIFAIPGLGYYFVNSVSQRDYTTIMGVTIFYAAFLMAMVLLVDVFYCMIDPRIKFES